MPSMFERATKKLVKEIGNKELRPVKSLRNATKIRPFSLIRRKHACSLFWELPDVLCDVTLMDILEPHSSVPDAAVQASLSSSDTVVRKCRTGGSVDAGAEVTISGEATEYQESSFEYEIITTLYETWTDLEKRKLRDPEPSFLRQCREADMNLYVVTETVNLLKSSELQGLSSGTLLGKLFIPLNTFFKGEGQVDFLHVNKKKQTVPQGSVMAYTKKQLIFMKNGWEICHVENDMRDTFTKDLGFHGISGSLRGYVGDLLCPGFQCLEEEVSRAIEKAPLSKEIKDIACASILAILEDREALQDLVDMLELESMDHLDGPGGTLINELQKASSCPWVDSKYLILHLLEAIMVLSDIQHDLLAQAMRKEILPQQRNLVRSILEPNFECSQSIPFTLGPELLAPLQAEDLAIACGLLTECGLTMEPNSPTLTWDPEAKQSLCALYETLAILQQLAEG